MFIMLKKTHELILSRLETNFKVSLSIKNEIIGAMKKRKDELFALNADKMLQIEKLQSRLENAVEGLSTDEVKISRASVDGNYIYRVTDCFENEIDVIVPKSLTNFDGYAKSETIKKSGLPWKCYKNLAAKRLTL